MIEIGDVVRITFDVVDDGERQLLAGDLARVVDIDEADGQVFAVVRGRSRFTTVGLGLDCEIAAGGAPIASA